MSVTNVVEAILGREQVKWDALWHLFAWLLDANEGHELGSRIVDDFCRHAFGRTFDSCKLRSEYQLSSVKDGKGKWADLALAIPSFDRPTHVVVMDDIDLRSPGGKRKLDNLKSYLSLARELFPSAVIRAIVLTNAHDGTTMKKVYDNLGLEVKDTVVAEGWRLLPLQVVGGWIAQALQASSPSPQEKIGLFLSDFVEWSRLLDTRSISIITKDVVPGTI